MTSRDFLTNRKRQNHRMLENLQLKKNRFTSILFWPRSFFTSAYRLFMSVYHFQNTPEISFGL